MLLPPTQCRPKSSSPRGSLTIRKLVAQRLSPKLTTWPTTLLAYFFSSRRRRSRRTTQGPQSRTKTAYPSNESRTATSPIIARRTRALTFVTRISARWDTQWPLVGPRRSPQSLQLCTTSGSISGRPLPLLPKNPGHLSKRNPQWFNGGTEYEIRGFCL